MKLSRLYQPRNPLFWLIIVLNLLSTGLAWMLRSLPLAWPAMLLIGLFALGNAALGIVLALRLMREPER